MARMASSRRRSSSSGRSSPLSPAASPRVGGFAPKASSLWAAPSRTEPFSLSKAAVSTWDSSSSGSKGRSSGSFSASSARIWEGESGAPQRESGLTGFTGRPPVPAGFSCCKAGSLDRENTGFPPAFSSASGKKSPTARPAEPASAKTSGVSSYAAGCASGAAAGAPQRARESRCLSGRKGSRSGSAGVSFWGAGGVRTPSSRTSPVRGSTLSPSFSASFLRRRSSLGSKRKFSSAWSKLWSGETTGCSGIPRSSPPIGMSIRGWRVRSSSSRRSRWTA